MATQSNKVRFTKRVEVINEAVSENPILDLQLKMATSSINHEYARLEFDDTKDFERRAELLDFMECCRAEYLNARGSLVNHDPLALEEFEADLLRQKQAVSVQYVM